MTDVARHAGVAQATVSNVLNHPSRVKQSTIERVQQSILELGFVPNRNAQALASGRNRSIGLVLTGLDHSFAIDTARGAQEAATARGYQLLITSAANDVVLENEHVDFFVGANVAGILLTPLVESHDLLRRPSSRTIPTVILNYHGDDHKHCYVVTDNEQGGYLAAQHLIESGCSQLALVTGGELQQVLERGRGVRRAVAEASHGVRLEEIEIADVFRDDESLELGRQLADRTEAARPDGVIGVTDMVASGVMRGLVSRGTSVPRDVAVMGCDSNSFAWGATMPLTTVDGNSAARAAAAVELLLDEAEAADGSHHHRTVVVEPTLIIRESTRR